MNETPSLFAQTVRDLRRRRVFRVGAMYGVVAWFVVQAAEATFEPLGVPRWVHTVVVVAVLGGFPVAVLVAWLFDLGPGGVVRTEPAAGDAPQVTWWSRRFVDLVVIGALLGLVLFLWLRPPLNTGSAGAAIRSIAVLPFSDFSEGSDQAYFAYGIAEELLNALVRIDGLRVAARTSSFAYGSGDRDIRRIGEELNVDTVLEGSVRRSGDRVRINAQLVNAADGFRVWSETYDREVTDIFEVQDDIARNIMSALQMELSRGGGEQVVSAPTGSLRAYDLYLAGRHHWQQRTRESLQQALGLFREAVAIDPNFAPAFAGLADTYLLLHEAQYGTLTQQEVLRHAEPAIARALALDNQLAEAYASFGLLRWSLGESEAAELALRKAIDLQYGYSMAHMWLGGVLKERGEDLNAAYEEYAIAHKSDPRHPAVNTNLIAVLVSLGRADEAAALAERIATLEGDTPRASLLRGEVALWSGRPDDAVRWLSRASEQEPDDDKIAAMLVHAFLELGDFERAQRRLDALEARAPTNLMLTHLRAQLHLARGDFQALAEVASMRDAGGDLDSAAGFAGEMERMVRVWAGVAQMGMGRPAEAVRLIESAVSGLGDRLLGEPDDHILVHGLLAIAYRRTGQPERARAVLEGNFEAERRARGAGWAKPGLDMAIAGTYALLDRNDEALDAMQRAIDRGWSNSWLVRSLPSFDALHGDARYERLLRNLETEIGIMRERASQYGSRLAGRDASALAPRSN